MNDQDLPDHKDILIVDDERSITKALLYILRRVGFLCDSAMTGFQALDLMSHTSYRVALIDSEMPGMTGRQLCCKIRDELKIQDLYIIMMSALPKRFCSDSGSISEIDEFVEKPFDPGSMIRRLKEIIPERGSCEK